MDNIEINADDLLDTASVLYENFQHEDVRLGIAILAAALLVPDVDIPFKGDAPIVKITDKAIRAVRFHA